MNIVLVGNGRVAFQLGHAMARAGHELLAVVGRNAERTSNLAKDLGTRSLSMKDAFPGAEVILIAVSDDAISDVTANIPITDAVVVHPSGASDLDRLLPHPDRAVMWPIMTLSTGVPVDFQRIPLVIDANTDHAKKVVNQLATSLSGRVQEVGHSDRELIHAAAAISTNFPLHLLDRAQELLRVRNIDPTLLLPSFMAMAEKMRNTAPHDALTGPARRGDIGTVQHHLDRLTHDPELRATYALLSSMILRAYGHPDHERNDV